MPRTITKQLGINAPVAAVMRELSTAVQHIRIRGRTGLERPVGTISPRAPFGRCQQYDKSARNSAAGHAADVEEARSS
jgi:hypothetical protein